MDRPRGHTRDGGRSAERTSAIRPQRAEATDTASHELQAFARLIGKLPPDEIATLLAAAPALQHLHELDDDHRAAAYQAAGQAADPSAHRARLEE